MNQPPPTRRQAGFSLVELLVAAAVGSLIVGAMAESVGLFGEHVEQVRADAEGGPDEVLALMTDMARHGWSVEHPADGQLRVVAPDGALTRFELDDGTLSITRPSGASGTLLEGVAALSIDTDSVRRLREAEPLHTYRTWWQRELPEELLGSVTLESGLPMALGFRMASDVPDDFDVVADVEEHAESALLETLVVPLSFLSAIPADPNEPITGDPDDDSPGNGNGKKKVDICHVPPGNPDNAHTLSVNENAVQAHLDHGDWLGTCEAPPAGETTAVLYVQLFEARAPDDARPYGQALGAISIPAAALPQGSAVWVATQTGGHDECSHGSEECDATTPNGKVIICHVPPGNPGNAHAITISPNAVPAHLAHGDYYGNCGEHDDTEDVWVLDIDAPPIETGLDLTALNALILPGRAYSLVFELQGEGFVFVGGAELASSAHSGVAQAAVADGELHALQVSVPFELKGTQTITQTAEHHPVSRVSLALEMDNGHAAHGSASVFGQVSVPGEWLGTVPGELAVEQGGDHP